MPPEKRKSTADPVKAPKKPKTTAKMPVRVKPAPDGQISGDTLDSGYPHIPTPGKMKSTPIVIDDGTSDDEFVNLATCFRSLLTCVVNRFYSSGSGSPTSSPTQQNLSKMFDSYRGKTRQYI